MFKDTTKKEWVADMLSASFGQSGDFTVVVTSEDGTTGKEESDGGDDERKDDGGAQRTEFKVWSVILSSWSDVFEKMMSHNLKEKAEQEVVIQDFSSHGVEAFLRFLYSGTLEGSLSTLVEVVAIADKYQVSKLSRHCQDVLADQLSAETAWSIFEAADCFQLEELREESLHAILKEPKVALAKRPSSETLLNEVLSSDLLCISHEELLNLLVKWEEVEGCESRINFIEKYVSMENISQEKLRVLKNVVVDDSQFQRLRSLKLACARSEYTNDAIQRILQHFGGFNGGIDQTQSFLSNWVNVLYSRSFSPGHLAHFSWMPEEDLTIFEALGEQLTFVPGDTHDARFKLQVCRPSRRSCRTAMDAVAGTKSPALQRVVEELCQIFQMELHRCWVNLYRAGTDDHAAFHRDHFDGRSGGAQVTLGVFASFGDRRDLCWSFGGRATAWRLPLRNGDVVAFDRTANAAGLHSIEKKLDAAEDRISVSLWGTGRIPGHAPCPPFAPPARRWRAKEAPPPRRWTRRETVEEKRNMGGGGGGGRWE
ncbi:BTB and MATH domain-containing protein 40 [Durusdinium trenchii]|uniref:BTB and MATH domain-containing protein 40 n=1 Tax=Durusdinium trenchii TaxID=1381693 RepID=A0ABP0RND7_9DINO